VWYQVFPERFANGNPANDPSGPDTNLLAWNAPWDTASVYELEQSWAQYAVDPRFYRPASLSSGGVLPATIYRRRFGGDLQGVVQRLDHLQSLGVTGLYLCPVFHAQSLHKYEAADHRHIDPTLGHPGDPGPMGNARSAIIHDPSETADPATWRWTADDRYLLETLRPEARERNLRVVLDGVWNHVGLWNWAFMDVVEHGVNSPYAEWFECRFDDTGTLVGWEGWSQPNGALPEFKHTDDGDLNPGVKAFVFDLTRRWMDPNNDGDPSDGIDGWRLDVANEIGRKFWADWRTLVRSINPDALIIGEIWFPGGDYFDGTAFDAQMNYPFAYQIAGWLSLDPAMTSERLARGLEQVYSNAPHTDLAQMTLLASHDTERVASLMHNPGRAGVRGFDQGANSFDTGTGYNARRPDERAFNLSVLGAALHATLPGSPMIYNGDELGMYGADDPNNRKPIPWPDLQDRKSVV
jgi:glycosidase